MKEQLAKIKEEAVASFQAAATAAEIGRASCRERV